ncbi:MAG: hypothetical protein PHH54_00795 [Candidatus Nanoarchaeia archaeon]|nr:hypothetical protein [Candidatus Nanoarchaeia archaeon]MDD5740500.1 hypothetical protein [Candidatus Nanoarchaeia archaeon]
MKIDKVTLEDENYLTDLDIYGSLNAKEARTLENLAKRCAYVLSLFGKSFVDTDNYHGFSGLIASARIKYTPNKEDSDNPLKFHLSYDGLKIKLFFKMFQRKFGKIDEPKITYE